MAGILQFAEYTLGVKDVWVCPWNAAGNNYSGTPDRIARPEMIDASSVSVNDHAFDGGLPRDFLTVPTHFELSLEMKGMDRSACMIMAGTRVHDVSGVANTTATATASRTGNSVSSIAVTNSGGGYTSPPAVTISGGGGSGAQATALIEGGKVTSIAVTNGGSGYSTNPTVAIAAPPSGTSGLKFSAYTEMGKPLPPFGMLCRVVASDGLLLASFPKVTLRSLPDFSADGKSFEYAMSNVEADAEAVDISPLNGMAMFMTGYQRASEFVAPATASAFLAFMKDPV